MKWMPTAITVALTLVGVFTPQINGFVTSHPSSAVVFAGIWAIVKGLAASPLGKGVQ